jgi:hypothetical protein
MKVETIIAKDALIETLKMLGYEWETYLDEDEKREYLFARGSTDGIAILISCKPNECKVEAPDYDVAPCYTKPALVEKCVYEVVSRVKEAEKTISELLQIAEELVKYGFKVSRSNRGVSVIVHKSMDDGEIKIILNPPKYDSVLRMEIRAHPTKLISVAMKLAELQL